MANDSTFLGHAGRELPDVPASWAWDAAHGLVSEALRFGGRVVSVSERGGRSVASAAVSGGGAPPRGGNGSQSPSGGKDDCAALVRGVVTAEAVDEAASYDAIGEHREARRRREALFVEGLRAWLGCAEVLVVADVVGGFAFLLGVSTQTVKRYLKAHSSVFGEFALDGERVRLRS